MWHKDEYSEALSTSRKYFPKARIVVDHFHIIQNAIKLMDQHLTLKCFWKILHQLRKVYWQKDYREAHSQLRYVIWLCEQNGIPEMETLSKTLRK